MMDFCTDVLDSDYYGGTAPETSDPEIARMQRYLDRLFHGPCVDHYGWGSITCFH